MQKSKLTPAGRPASADHSNLGHNEADCDLRSWLEQVRENPRWTLATSPSLLVLKNPTDEKCSAIST